VCIVMAESQTQDRLNSKVQGLRSQGLSFAKDGIDFTLDVPDTTDVKAVFGSMVETIVTQEQQIVTLNETIEKNNEEFKKAQAEIMWWAQANIDQLNAKNDLLFEKLMDARSQIKNFSYNIQGYEGEEEDDMEQRMKEIKRTATGETPISVPPTPAIRPKADVKPEDPLLFPTEDGAPIESTLSVEKKPAVEAVEKEKTPEKPAPQKLLDLALEEADPEVKPKVDTRSEVQKMTPKARWQWAFRRVVQKARVTKLCIGFTRARMNKSDSVIERLERVEQRMFFIPLECRTYANDLTTSLDLKLTEELRRLEEQQNNFSRKTIENLQTLDSNIASLNAEIADLKTTVEEAVTSQANQIAADLKDLKDARDDDVSRLHASLKDKLSTIVVGFASLEGDARRISKEVADLMETNSKLYSGGSNDSISALLQVDTSMRTLREMVALVESDASVVSSSGKALRNELESILGTKSREVISKIDSVLEGGLDGVREQIANAKQCLQRHDQILSDRWVSLSGMMKAMKSISGVSHKLEKLECDVENKVSAEEAKEICKDMAAAAVTESQGSLATSIQTLQSEVENHNERLNVVEENQIMQPVVKATDAPSSGKVSPRSSQQVQQVSNMVTGAWDPAEMESKLQPLIKDIVEMYMNDWDRNDEVFDDGYDDEYENDEGYVDPVDDTQEAYEEPGIVEEIRNSSNAVFRPMDSFEADLAALDAVGVSPSPTSNNVFDGSPLEVSRQQSPQLQQQQQKIDSSAPKKVEEQIPQRKESVRTQLPPTVRTQGSAEYQESGTTTKPMGNQLSSPPVASSSGTATPTGQVGQPALGQTKKNPSQTPVAQPQSVRGAKTRPNELAEVHNSRRGSRIEQMTSSDTGNRKLRRRDGEDDDSSTGSKNQAGKMKHRIRQLHSDDFSDGSPGRDTPTGRGRRNRQQGPPPIDMAEINKLKADIRELQDRLDSFNRSKIDVESVRALMAQKADVKFLDRKVDTKVVETIEDTVKDVMVEVGDLRMLQEEEIARLKTQMAKKIKSSLKALMLEREENSKGANATYKGLCLSCGQKSPVRVQSGYTNPPPFLPAINANSSAGPEVLRGGFRMPVSVPQSSHSKIESFLNSTMAGNSLSEFTPSSSRVSPEAAEDLDLGDDSASSAFRANSKQGKRKKKEPTPVSATYLEETSSVRSIHRKGFPAKKSQRAVVSVLHK